VQHAVLVEAELELGVGDDDAARARVLGGFGIEAQRSVAHLCSEVRADAAFDLGEIDVLVVLADRGLVGRREDRLRQPVGELQAALTRLELAGAVAGVPGGRYQRLARSRS
jgi:hypothetical protein